MFERDTAVLNPVISSEAESGQIHLNVVTVLCSTKNLAGAKEDLLERRYFTENMPLLTPSHSFNTCVGPDTLSSTTVFKKRGIKTGLGRLHPEYSFGLPYLYMYIYIYLLKQENSAKKCSISSTYPHTGQTDRPVCGSSTYVKRCVPPCKSKCNLTDIYTEAER